MKSGRDKHGHHRTSQPSGRGRHAPPDAGGQGVDLSRRSRARFPSRIGGPTRDSKQDHQHRMEQGEHSIGSFGGGWRWGEQSIWRAIRGAPLASPGGSAAGEVRAARRAGKPARRCQTASSASPGAGQLQAATAGGRASSGPTRTKRRASLSSTQIGALLPAVLLQVLIERRASKASGSDPPVCVRPRAALLLHGQEPTWAGRSRRATAPVMPGISRSGTSWGDAPPAS